MVILYKCVNCKGEYPKDSFGEYSGHRRRTCFKCRERIKKYHKDNRLELLEKRRERYHSDPERYTKNKNLGWIQKARSNPERRKQMFGVYLKRKYNLSLQEYDKMLEQQQNKCAICKVEFSQSIKDWNRCCVDHCHKTNRVRGLLCRKCNISLHYIEDFKYWVAAQSYLGFNEVGDKELLHKL